MDEMNFTVKPSFKDRLRRLEWKKIALIAAAAVVLVVLVLVLLSLGNTRNAPVSVMQKYANAKEIKEETLYKDLLAGVEGGNAAKIIKLLKTSDEFKDDLADEEERFADRYEDMVDEYGKNFKITYKNDKSVEEKLDRDDLKDYRARIKSIGEDYADLGKTLGKLKSADLKDLAEDLDLSTSDAKALIDAMKTLGQKLKGVEVSDGYALEVLSRITGSELDDPEEDDMDLIVLKVDGKWVSYSSFSLLSSLYSRIYTAVQKYI